MFFFLWLTILKIGIYYCILTASYHTISSWEKFCFSWNQYIIQGMIHLWNYCVRKVDDSIWTFYLIFFFEVSVCLGICLILLSLFSMFCKTFWNSFASSFKLVISWCCSNLSVKWKECNLCERNSHFLRCICMFVLNNALPVNTVYSWNSYLY